jgi:hypothetical protein
MTGTALEPKSFEPRDHDGNHFGNCAYLNVFTNYSLVLLDLFHIQGDQHAIPQLTDKSRLLWKQEKKQIKPVKKN